MTLNISSIKVGNSDDETSFPRKLLLTNIQVSKICKAFANASSTNIKFSKTQLSKSSQEYSQLPKMSQEYSEYGQYNEYRQKELLVSYM